MEMVKNLYLRKNQGGDLYFITRVINLRKKESNEETLSLYYY